MGTCEGLQETSGIAVMDGGQVFIPHPSREAPALQTLAFYLQPRYQNQRAEGEMINSWPRARTRGGLQNLGVPCGGPDVQKC